MSLMKTLFFHIINHRHKMLYSSSRDDLKRSLGLAFFAGDFNANALDEVGPSKSSFVLSPSAPPAR